MKNAKTSQKEKRKLSQQINWRDWSMDGYEEKEREKFRQLLQTLYT